MKRRSNSITLYLLACVVVMSLLAGCGGNAAPAPAATATTAAAVATATIAPASATNTPLEPTMPAATATAVPTQAEATPTLEISTPTAEPTATEAVPTQTTEVDQPPMPVMPTLMPVAEGTPGIPASNAEELIKARASEAIEALKNKDMKKLSELVHPEKGLSFAPYQFIDDTNVTLTREELAGALADQTTRTWGAYDGTGDPMVLTFEDYYDNFIYNHDFAAAPNISYNQFKGHGNSINNIFAVYPAAISVEYHFPGFDPQYEGMDWQALYLVFDRHTDGNWYLVHITHGQWTI